MRNCSIPSRSAAAPNVTGGLFPALRSANVTSRCHHEPLHRHYVLHLEVKSVYKPGVGSWKPESFALLYPTPLLNMMSADGGISRIATEGC